ncbi:MAG: cytochrome c peroxidase [Bacteroidota bacterium]
MSRSKKYRSTIWIAVGIFLLAAGYWYFTANHLKRQFSPLEWQIITEISEKPAPPKDPSNQYLNHPAAIKFGEQLFFSPLLSKDKTISCATCHPKENNWMDGKAVAVGSEKGTRNTPSLWNTVHNRWYFWDGRADSQWSQALQPFETPEEMGSSRLAVLHALNNDDGLKQGYEKLFETNLDFLADSVRFPPFGSPVIEFGLENPWLNMAPEDQHLINQHFVNIGKSIAAFEGTILSPPSDFDRFVHAVSNNQQTDYPESALKGLKIFLRKGNCTNCHSGFLLTNKEFHNIRLNEENGGRYEGIRKLLVSNFNKNSSFSDDPTTSRIEYVKLVKRNWGEFKVPSLRNVLYTAPYMHDGRFATLRDVIDYYSELKEAVPDIHVNETIIKPLNLTEEEKCNLEDFLSTL